MGNVGASLIGPLKGSMPYINIPHPENIFMLRCARKGHADFLGRYY